MKSIKINIIFFVLIICCVLLAFGFLGGAFAQMNELTKNYKYVYLANKPIDFQNWQQFAYLRFDNHDFFNILFIHIWDSFNFILYGSQDGTSNFATLSNNVLNYLVFFGLLFLQIVLPIVIIIFFIFFILDIQYIKAHNYTLRNIKRTSMAESFSNRETESKFLSENEKSSLHNLRVLSSSGLAPYKNKKDDNHNNKNTKTSDK